MSLHNEIEFENEICQYLAVNGWLYSKEKQRGHSTLQCNND